MRDNILITILLSIIIVFVITSWELYDEDEIIDINDYTSISKNSPEINETWYRIQNNDTIYANILQIQNEGNLYVNVYINEDSCFDLELFNIDQFKQLFNKIEQ